MAYNYNYFPVGYQPYGQMPPQPQFRQPVPQQAQPQQQNGIIWVQGMEGAKSFLIAPNTAVMLMDSEAPVFYIKSADASGMPTLRVFDYKERVQQAQENVVLPQPAMQQPQQVDMSNYVTKEEMERRFAEERKGGVNNEPAV